MYKDLRHLLENAEGISQFIIGVNIDVRDFTPFCQNVDSADVALFIKKMYIKIIDNYFSELEFYKPTGDGLLLVMPYNEETLKRVSNDILKKCLDILYNFDNFFNDEPMIYFDVPKKIGIGISMGSACCLKSDEKVIDYSGRVLNIASRLMDIARPSGIVIDKKFNMDIIEDDIKKLFSEEVVYLKGIARARKEEIFKDSEFTIYVKYPITKGN